MTYQQATPRAVDLTSLVDAIPDMVFMLDPEGRVVFANNTCHELLGWDEAGLGRGALEFVHPEDAAMVASSMTTIHGKPVGTPIEFRVRDRSDRWRWVELIGRDCLATPGLARVRVRRSRRGPAQDVGAGRNRPDAVPARVATWCGDDRVDRRSGQHHQHQQRVQPDPRPRQVGRHRPTTRDLRHRRLRRAGTCGDRPRGRHRSGAVVGPDDAAGRPRRDPCPMRFELRSLDDPSASGGRVVATGQDITDLVNVRRELEHRAQHDPMTGLANRSLLRRAGRQNGLATGDAVRGVVHRPRRLQGDQ